MTTGYCSLLRAALRLHSSFATPDATAQGSGRQFSYCRQLFYTAKYTIFPEKQKIFRTAASSGKKETGFPDRLNLSEKLAYRYG